MSGFNKSTRMIGGRKLTYRPSAPVPGSYRSRVSRAAVAAARNALELKGVDVGLTLTPVIATSTTNGSAFLLNAIAPGSGSFNRIGRKAHLKSLRLKGAFQVSQTPSATGAVGGACVRMVVVWDLQPNSGSIPTWDVIFGTTDQAGTEASTVLSPLRYDNMNRFHVLKDKSYDYATVPGNVVSTATQIGFMPFDEYINLGGRETNYSGQSATCTTADISTGALYVYFRAQLNDATVAVSVGSNSIARLRYVD